MSNILEQQSFPGLPKVEEDKTGFYGGVCHSIADNLEAFIILEHSDEMPQCLNNWHDYFQTLESNWSESAAEVAAASEISSSRYQMFRKDPIEDRFYIQMDEKRIVHVNIDDKSCLIFNRWDLSLENVYLGLNQYYMCYAKYKTFPNETIYKLSVW